MAQQTIVTLIDDLDSSIEADETVSFGLDGTNYEIDLSTEHAEQLRQALATWITSARRAGRTTASKTGPRKTSAATGVDPAAVRAWAASNNITVSARGRVPASVIEQFRAAGN